MTILISLLVGAHFRPPAKQLLTALPAGQSLLLIPEPDNPYDSNAVKVAVVPETIDIDNAIINSALEGTGSVIEDFSPVEPLHLGYLPTKLPKGFEAPPR